MANITNNFTTEEMKCRHCGDVQINQASVERLQRVRNRYGKSMQVNSGYRCPQHNAEISNTGANGPHTTGQAFDIGVEGEDALWIVGLALAEGFTGVGLNQKGETGGRFVHLDDLPAAPGRRRPHVWTY